jgi:hypothetical protein
MLPLASQTPSTGQHVTGTARQRLPVNLSTSHIISNKATITSQARPFLAGYLVGLPEQIPLPMFLDVIPHEVSQQLRSSTVLAFGRSLESIPQGGVNTDSKVDLF